MIIERWQDYERFLTNQLCWVDGSPTHSSSALQRQCPLCRQKWSYRRRQRQWVLARRYCEGLSALSACRQNGTAYSTASKLFAQLDQDVPTRLRKALLQNVLRETERFVAEVEAGQFDTIERLRVFRNDSRRANRLLLLKLPMSERLQVVFEALLSSDGI